MVYPLDFRVLYFSQPSKFDDRREKETILRALVLHVCLEEYKFHVWFLTLGPSFSVPSVVVPVPTQVRRLLTPQTYFLRDREGEPDELGVFDYSPH